MAGFARRAAGRALALGMPGFLSFLSVAGTAVMIWARGGNRVPRISCTAQEGGVQVTDGRHLKDNLSTPDTFHVGVCLPGKSYGDSALRARQAIAELAKDTSNIAFGSRFDR